MTTSLVLEEEGEQTNLERIQSLYNLTVKESSEEPIKILRIYQYPVRGVMGT